jgi:hypothetical protein
MLLQTRTRETVDCVASHHNIQKGYHRISSNLGQNAFRRKKNTGQNKANISAQAENMETGSSRY